MPLNFHILNLIIMIIIVKCHYKVQLIDEIILYIIEVCILNIKLANLISRDSFQINLWCNSKWAIFSHSIH